MDVKDKLVLALDVDNMQDVEALVTELKDIVGVFKVGKQLFTKYGPKVVDYIHLQGGKVFLDLKFHDIPNTVAGAARCATQLGVFMFNVHIPGGREMMKAAIEAAEEEALKLKIQTPIVLGVTVLTSIAELFLRNDLKIEQDLNAYVGHLATLAKECGLHGVVASPREVTIVRKRCGQDFTILTPGIRPEWAATDDQVRVTTPADAILMGSDYLVIGRPILKASSKKQVALKILHEIEQEVI